MGNGPWRGRVDDDGTLAIEIDGALGKGACRADPVALDDAAWFAAQRAADRVPAKPRPTRAEDTEATALAGAFGRYLALVIGNDSYEHLTLLRTARADARAVSEVLRDSYGFEVETLLDATREQILVAFAGLRKNLGPDDKVLIY